MVEAGRAVGTDMPNTSLGLPSEMAVKCIEEASAGFPGRVKELVSASSLLPAETWYR